MTQALRYLLFTVDQHVDTRNAFGGVRQSIAPHNACPPDDAEAWRPRVAPNHGVAPHDRESCLKTLSPHTTEELQLEAVPQIPEASIARRRCQSPRSKIAIGDLAEPVCILTVQSRPNVRVTCPDREDIVRVLIDRSSNRICRQTGGWKGLGRAVSAL
jgi:hypothetical protein